MGATESGSLAGKEGRDLHNSYLHNMHQQVMEANDRTIGSSCFNEHFLIVGFPNGREGALYLSMDIPLHIKRVLAHIQVGASKEHP